MDSVSHVTCLHLPVCTDGFLRWRHTQALYNPRLYTTPTPMKTPCRVIEHISSLLKGELHDHNHHSAVAKIDCNPVSDTDKHKSWNQESFCVVVVPCQIEDEFGTSAPRWENTTPSNSGCLQASENMMHFHKCIFIQPWLAWVRLSWRIWITSILNDQKLFSE